MTEGDRVIAPDKNDKCRPAVIENDLSTMYFVVFDDSTDNFVNKTDTRIRPLEENDDR